MKQNLIERLNELVDEIKEEFEVSEELVWDVVFNRAEEALEDLE